MEIGAGDGARALQRILGDLPGELRLQHALGPYTTFRIGGPAWALFSPAEPQALAEAVVRARAHGFRWRLLGGGSKVLIPDQGFPGLVLTTAHLQGWEESEGVIQAGAGVPLARLARRGLWKVAGIPGTVGGAVTMNAGTKYGSISEFVVWVRALMPDGYVHTFLPHECGFAYRDSLFRRLRLPVLEAAFRPAPGPSVDDLLRERRASQPVGLPSAGCVFRNPPDGPSAGWLIDRLGLKGLRLGDAVVSEKHANFICNLGRARSGDVLGLAEHVWERVGRECGVWLRLELEIVSG